MEPGARRHMSENDYIALDSLSGNQIRQAYRYCRDLTIQADTNFALGFRFLPGPKRDAIYALYAFNRCADDFADETSDPADAESRISQWQKALDACYDGRVRHPVLIAFADAVRRYQVPKQPFLDALDGFRMDLSVNRFATFDDLMGYCNRVAGTISVMSLCVFGYSDPAVEALGRDLSTALQLTNIIRDVGEDVERNRIYLPLEDLKRFGYSEQALLAKTYNENFQDLMRFQVQRARSYFREANALVPLLDRDARLTTWLMGSAYSRILQKIETGKFRVLERKTQLTVGEKIGLVITSMVSPRYV